MLWDKTMPCYSPIATHFVFEIGMPLVWASVDESTHLSEKMPVSDVDYPVDC